MKYAHLFLGSLFAAYSILDYQDKRWSWLVFVAITSIINFIAFALICQKQRAEKKAVMDEYLKAARQRGFGTKINE